MKSKHCLVFLVVLFLTCTPSKANFVFLYEKIHFYEIKTNFNVQPFSTFIGGDGTCAAELEEKHISLPLNSNNQGQTKLDKEYQIEVNTLIYSNYEKTLSFLIEIEFNSISIPGLHKIEGYELKFYFDEDHSSCVQIIADQGEPLTSFKRYKFTIKDPAFLSHEDPRFSFYFGKIVIRALTSCENTKSIGFKDGKLCAVGSSESSPLEIGIKSEKLVDNSKLSPDLCKGHLMQQTCIIRYNTLYTPDDDYYIILHAMSDEFERILGDSDIFSLDSDQIKRVDEARNSGKKTIFFENIEYNTNLEKESLYFAPNLVSKRTQMMANGLIAKFIKAGDRISYMGILDGTTIKNTCLNQTDGINKQCRCGDECIECYKLEQQPNSKDVINYIPLNYDGSKKAKKSKHCSDDHFNFYNFDNTKIAFRFQSQDLSSERKLENSDSMISNRDFLPRLCIDFKYGEAKSFYKLNILFNDYRRVAESSVINTTYYRLNLFEYNYVDRNIHKKSYDKKYLFRLDVKPVLSIDSVNSKQLVEITDLKKGKYFLELQVKQKSKFCPKTDECVDESASNNEIRCIKCDRLLIKFDLQSKLVSDSNLPEPIKKYSREYCHRIKPKIKFKHLDKKINLNSFKCPKESSVLANIIKNSNFDLNEIFFKTETLAGILPGNYNLSLMMLPFDFSEQIDLIEFCDVMEFVNVFDNRYSLLIIILFVIIILIFIIVYLISFQNIVNYAFTSNKKIVFYLSIFLNKEQQEKLNEFTIKYTNILKKRFKNFSIEILSYSTDFQTRSEAIANADKIIYVCGTKDEIKNLQSPFIIIGQNKFHDEYNMLHFFPQYEAKTINVTFNQQVFALNLSNSEATSEESSLINSTESKGTSGESSPKLSNFSNSSSVIRSLSYQEALNHKYLKLPEQNKLLISFLLGPDENCLFGYSTSKDSYFNQIHKLARDLCIKRFDNNSKCLIKNERSNVFYFERNNFYDDEKTLEYLEINDPEFESLIPMYSITSSTQSMSNESSKTTYDANELTNEVEQTEQKPLINSNRNFY